MRCSRLWIVLVSCTCALTSLTVAADNLSTSDIAWLSGHWEGVGDDGKTKGKALSIWTPPVEGSMSWTFRWHQAEQGHVHFAFSLLEETDYKDGRQAYCTGESGRAPVRLRRRGKRFPCRCSATAGTAATQHRTVAVHEWQRWRFSMFRDFSRQTSNSRNNGRNTG
jgi:hypothetical protein